MRWNWLSCLPHRLFARLLLPSLLVFFQLHAQNLEKPDVIINPNPYPAEEDAELVKLFEGLRVADVSDALDIVGLADRGLVDPAIQPLWRDTDQFTHRICGIALTVRYVPTNHPYGPPDPQKFPDWERQWYRQLSPEPFVDFIRPTTVILIDGHEDGDTGTIGSNNSLSWKARGARGIVTSGGARDTDEIIKQRIPLYYRRPGRGIRPGRNEIESVNRPVTIGGVLIRPGDVIVADGDGVVVVPRRVARQVATYARKILEADKAGRRRLYEKLGLPLDPSVEP